MTLVLFSIVIIFIFLSELWILIRPPFASAKLRKYIRRILFLVDTIFLIWLLVLVLIDHPYNGPSNYLRFSLWMMLFMIVYSPRWFVVIFELFRSFTLILKWPKISFLLRISGFIIALIWFALVITGISWTKNSPVLTETIIVSERIPKAFDGFRIIQISDLHLGSFRQTGTIERSVNLIKKAQPDIIVMTGDLVNLFPQEADAFIQIIASLNPPFGKYAVLGNHDFANSFGSELDNLESNDIADSVEIKLMEMGFTVLRDRHTYIFKGKDSIAIAGVDNIGLPPFIAHGNLEIAIRDIPSAVYTILLSHDPTHWQSQVLPSKAADLTLSGHTHGMQIGWRNAFSFVKIKYNEWSGLYTKDNRFLYVNTGLGFIGLPFRIGIRPEVSLLILNNPSL